MRTPQEYVLIGTAWVIGVLAASGLLVVWVTRSSIEWSLLSLVVVAAGVAAFNHYFGYGAQRRRKRKSNEEVDG